MFPFFSIEDCIDFGTIRSRHVGGANAAIDNQSLSDKLEEHFIRLVLGGMIAYTFLGANATGSLYVQLGSTKTPYRRITLHARTYAAEAKDVTFIYPLPSGDQTNNLHNNKKEVMQYPIVWFPGDNIQLYATALGAGSSVTVETSIDVATFWNPFLRVRQQKPRLGLMT